MSKSPWPLTARIWSFSKLFIRIYKYLQKISEFLCKKNSENHRHDRRLSILFSTTIWVCVEPWTQNDDRSTSVVSFDFFFFLDTSRNSPTTSQAEVEQFYFSSLFYLFLNIWTFFCLPLSGCNGVSVLSVHSVAIADHRSIGVSFEMIMNVNKIDDFLSTFVLSMIWTCLLESSKKHMLHHFID